MKASELIGGNWGLKILALVLAVVIYYTIKHSGILRSSETVRIEQTHK